MSKEIARMYGIPFETKINGKAGYTLDNVYRTRGPALKRAQSLRNKGWLATTKAVHKGGEKPHQRGVKTGWHKTDMKAYVEYAVYSRPKEGWNKR